MHVRNVTPARDAREAEGKVDLKERVRIIKALVEGGKGSGNFGHAGRPGKKGGSKAGTGGVQLRGITVNAGDFDLDNYADQIRRLYTGWGAEAGETLLCVTTDGKYVAVSSGEANQIGVGLGELRDALVNNGTRFWKLKTIVHNHQGTAEPSQTDQKVLAALRKYGFTGDYQIFDTENNKLRTVKDKTEAILQHLRDLLEEALKSCPKMDDPVPEDLVRRLAMLRDMANRT